MHNFHTSHSLTHTHTHTHTQMDAHVWGLTCTFSTNALGHAPTNGPNRPPPAAHTHTHTKTHTKTLF